MPEGGRYYKREEYPPRDTEGDPENYRNTGHPATNWRDHTDRPKDKISASEQDPLSNTDNTHHAHQNIYKSSVLPTEMDHYEARPRQIVYNLHYLLTARAICQMLEFFLNMLIVICAGVSYNSTGVYKDLASLGGLYAYYFGGANAFTGAEAERVKQLDQLFYQLKQPVYVYTMAYGGTLMGYASAMLILGILTVPFHYPVMLLVEAVLDGLIALGYMPAVAFYFIKLQEAYDTNVCKEREQLYKSKGHQGYECKFQGADICGGLFGVAGVIAFTFGAVLAIRAFIAVRKRKQRPHEDNAL